MGIDIGLSSLPLKNVYKYRLFFHGFLHQLVSTSFMIPLYLLRDSFSTMVYISTYGPFGILLGVFTPLLIRKKINKLVVQYFYKDLEIIKKSKFNGLKNPKNPKPTVSGNMPKQNCSWS